MKFRGVLIRNRNNTQTMNEGDSVDILIAQGRVAESFWQEGRGLCREDST